MSSFILMPIVMLRITGHQSRYIHYDFIKLFIKYSSKLRLVFDFIQPLVTETFFICNLKKYPEKLITLFIVMFLSNESRRYN